MRKAKLYLALLHYPMYNKKMDIITTSVTNLDLHDISRTARTYNIDRLFIVHPSIAQHELIKDILAYWSDGYGISYNPDRREAFALTCLKFNLQEVIREIHENTGKYPVLIATDARQYPESISYNDLRRKLEQEEEVFLLILGTGWGISKELMQECDLILEPVEAKRDYNHLPVRGAAAIMLDRLLGERWYEHRGQ